MRWATAITVTAFLLTSCVSSGKHEALQKKYKEAESTIEARDAKIKSLDEEITKLEGTVESLEAEKKTLEGKVAALETERLELKGELATVVKDKAKLKASAAELKKAIAELQERQDQANARLGQLKELLAKFKTLIDAGKLKVKIADGRMVLELPSDVLFASGKAKLNDAGAAAIADVAKVLATLRGRKFQIEGHTDNVPIKRRFQSNWDLAAARAITVVKAMIDAGVSQGMLSAASYGEIRPAYSNDSEQGRANNRRIEIVLVPDLSQLPGFQELNKAVK